MKYNKYKLLFIPLLIASLSLASCTRDGQSASVGSSDTSLESDREAALLSETADMGQEYIDSFIFIGESTTYHLKSRGVLRGGTETRQVWAPSSGTANLDTSVASLKIVFPDTGEEITVGDAMKRKKPRRVMLTFGLNGAVAKIKRGEDYFRSCYLSLINVIRENSPDTDVVLQSCFPIAENMDMSNFSVDAPTLMEHISTINGWTLRLAEDEGLSYLDTCETLKDSRGFLCSEYDSGDGHHLTKEAYIQILKYIRTHGITEER
ncbi:MAG: hypothetical protein J6B72_04335 [Clostridia bacterium]|nr:hypothetical protein [Clostridia bacterium]